MHGVGLDLLEIARLERAIDRRPGLALRLFTPAERSYAAQNARPAQHLAARFCAKEAVTKALGMDVFRPLEIEVVRGASGTPDVLLHGNAAARAEALGVSVAISLTHEFELAAAVAVAS